ncbi:MAG: hypothetical protein GX322_04300 [Firmicutes bacterium]|nr:hypothetical protein [Bacillota bacterium]
MTPLVAYIRLHHFYALLEAKSQRHLWQTPFVVVRNQKIIDVSSKAARLNIHTAMGLRQARLICPDLTVVEAKVDPLPMAEKFWDVCAELTPLVEPEDHQSVFLDLSGLGEPLHIIERAARYFHLQLPFPWQMGIASNKLIAKIAYREITKPEHDLSEKRSLTWIRGRGQSSSFLLEEKVSHRQPKGTNYLFIPPEDVKAFLAPLPVSRLWPWPEKIHQQLQNLGIYTIGQLAGVPPLQLEQQLGEVGRQLFTGAQGIDSTPVQGLYPRQTVQSYFHLPPEAEGCHDWETLAGHLVPMMADATAKLRKQAQVCTRLRILVQYHGCPPESWDKQLKNELQTEDRLLSIAQSLLMKKAWPAPIIGVRLMLMDLKPAPLNQGVLVPHMLRLRHPSELQQIMDLLQAKFGKDSIFLAADMTIPRRERMLQLLAGYQ